MRHKPLFFSRAYFPAPQDNKMSHVGDVEKARNNYLALRPPNLRFLLTKRYGWMNDVLPAQGKIIEIGAGAGLSREFISHPLLKLTDVTKNAWIDEQVDALALPYPDASVDAIIASHTIHHFAKPALFLEEAARVLKPGGKILIQEINTSLLMRMVLRVMRHEGYSYDIDIFDETAITSDPVDPWSANCAIPMLLFRDEAAFERRFPTLKIRKNKTGECLIFLLSGGVIAKTKTVALPAPLLRLADGIDSLLAALLPGVFALGRSVVIEKI